MNRLFAALALVLCSSALSAQPITLAVDATEVARGLVHATERIPVSAGSVTLLYPKWIPGEHGPTGPVTNVTNLQVSANGRRLAWQRDPIEMFAISLDVPTGVSTLDVTLDFLLPAGGDFSAGRTATTQLAVISWNTLVLYPRGKAAELIDVTPSLRIPAGWTHATALTVERAANHSIDFKTTSLTTLIDSPVQIGAHQKVVPLKQADGRPHEVVIAADGDPALELPENFANVYSGLVDQAGLLFGGRHYRGYRWLITLSDGVAHFGLEHHESSDDRLDESSLQTDSGRRWMAELLSHEYVHSWNGKYRRPAGLVSPSYETPMRGELLWVYEGLTQYLGEVLPGRIGAWTPEYSRERLAAVASDLEGETGRTWRPLADTAVEAQLLYGVWGGPWWASRRSVDFYDESVYIWLEADAIIRQKSGGKKSLDDFCRRFYGGYTGPEVKPYSFEDVVAAMNETQPNDWRTFFTTRLQSVDAHAPLGGLTLAGWKLDYNETPNDYSKDSEEVNKTLNFRQSLGLQLKDTGSIVDVNPVSPGARAGLAPGFTLIAINGRKFTPDTLRNAVKASKTATAPIEVIAQNGDFFGVYKVDYHGGAMYPHLVRVEGKPDLLSAIMSKR
jgi:predicted metalloprotease with PDZ domain